MCEENRKGNLGGSCDFFLIQKISISLARTREREREVEESLRQIDVASRNLSFLGTC